MSIWATGTAFRRAALASTLVVVANAAVAQTPRTNAPSPLVGRWSESTTCTRGATQFVFTASSFEIIGRDGRWYMAPVAHVRQGADPGVRLTAAPSFSRLGPAAPGQGDTYVFRNDPANRITPLEIVRANGRRDRVDNDTPVFTRCR